MLRLANQYICTMENERVLEDRGTVLKMASQYKSVKKAGIMLLLYYKLPGDSFLDTYRRVRRTGLHHLTDVKLLDSMMIAAEDYGKIDPAYTASYYELGLKLRAIELRAKARRAAENVDEDTSKAAEQVKEAGWFSTLFGENKKKVV